MLITPLKLEDFPLVVQSWNAWLPPRFQTDQRLLEQLTVGHPSWDPSLSRLAWEGDSLVGFALARPGHLDAVAVSPDRRREGVGTALCGELDVQRFGGGPAHFVPGAPEGWQEAESFLEKLGLVADWWAEDLHMNLSDREPEFTSATPEDKNAVLRMVSQEFSKRWTDDTRARFEHDDHQDVIIINDDQGPVAFCHAWHYQSNLLGPSTFWIRNTCARFGGIGPVGVRERARGLGLGGRIVVEALNYLAHRGVEEVVVDWTAIGDFYKKYGFHSWQKYRGYARG